MEKQQDGSAFPTNINFASYAYGCSLIGLASDQT